MSQFARENPDNPFGNMPWNVRAQYESAVATRAYNPQGVGECTSCRCGAHVERCGECGCGKRTPRA